MRLEDTKQELEGKGEGITNKKGTKVEGATMDREAPTKVKEATKNIT